MGDNDWLVNAFYLVDRLSGVPDAVQLHHPGEDGEMALSARVDRHLLHPHTGHRESPAGRPQNRKIFIFNQYRII